MRLREIGFFAAWLLAVGLVGCSGSIGGGLDDAGLLDGMAPDGLDAGGDERDGGTLDADAGPLDGADAGGDDPDGGMPDAADGGPDAGSDPGLDGGTLDGADAGGDAGPEYGAEFFVATDGDDQNPGTRDAPFASLERARQAIEELVSSSGIPEGGVVVWIRGGVYERTETFRLGAEHGGEEDRPVVYRGYPGEEARLAGARCLDPAWFSTVTDASVVWDRVDPLARGQLLQVDLAAHGIDDFGELRQRGFGLTANAALELFFDAEPMQLGRWPDRDANDPAQSHEDDMIELFGDPVPDVTGTWQADGTSDGVNRYTRQGLVDGRQYHLYRHNWDYQGTNHTAWFITTRDSGYPDDADPWWHRYDDELGGFNPGTGASGHPTIQDPGRVNHGFVSIASALSDTSFVYVGDRPDRWARAPDPWLHGYWMHMWADRHMPIESIDTASRTIGFAEVPGYGIESGQPYYAYNLLEEITRPGEWYLDRDSKILYFWPPADPAASESCVSMLAAPLVRLDGTSWVELRDLVFEMGRAELVRIDGGAHNRIAGCTLRNAGTDGARVTGEDNGLERCLLHHTGDRGAQLDGGDRAGLAEAGNFVRNCHLHHFGRWSWTYKPAVGVGRGCGNIVAHNWMHDAPHSAILYAGNENRIEYNEIHDVCRFSSDAGAIYAGRDWGWRGNLIRYNFIHHVQTWFEGYGVHGVYMDDCLSGIHVFGNVFYQVSGHAIQHGGGRDDIMENNIMARCGDALSADSRGIQRITNIPGDSWNMLERLTRDGVQYQQDPWASRYPALAAIPNDWDIISDPDALWLYPQGSVFSRNLGFANGVFTRESNYGGTGTFDKYAEMTDNIEDQDPLFVDEDNLDLSLQPGSPAHDIPGFQPIPFDQIGIQPEE